MDDATRGNAGDLGWVEEDDPFVDPHVLQAAKTMQEGQISEPVKLESGYAIVKLDGRKDVKKQNGLRTREEVRMDLALQEAPPLKDLINKLREKYHAAIVDDSLK
jgi:foldase protein PrsA